jgi:DNA modification methylase
MQSPYQETLAAVHGQVDLVMTSPPYADARTYGHNVSWTDTDYQALGDAVWLALKPGGQAIVNVDAPVREWRKGMGTERGFHPWKLMLDWGERIGFRVPDRLAYGRMGAIGAYTGRFRNDWEPLLWFIKPGGNPFFNKELLLKPALYPKKDGIIYSRAMDGQLMARSGSGMCVEQGLKHQGTYWEYGHVGHGHSGHEVLAGQGHPAIWPYRLARDIVKCFAAPGALVCDPFVGCGTSAIAALEHGCRFHGGDLYGREANAEKGWDAVPWIEVTRRMIDQHFQQVPLFSI